LRRGSPFGYIAAVSHLTKNEQFVLSVFFGLLVLGLCVKFYRQAHPPARPAVAVSPAKP
jgi:hypothetical protein